MENPEISPEALAALSAFVSPPTSRSDVNAQIQHLVSLSKKNGYVSIQNINDVIPDCATDPELIEFIMNTLDGLDIKLDGVASGVKDVTSDVKNVASDVKDVLRTASKAATKAAVAKAEQRERDAALTL